MLISVKKANENREVQYWQYVALTNKIYLIDFSGVVPAGGIAMH
jgi:hypothetical protein